MPVVNFHLLAGATDRSQSEQLLIDASHLYSEILQSPLVRVRAFITWHDPSDFAVAGAVCASSGANAPFFEFIVFNDRSVLQRQQLAEGFTELLVRHLGVSRDAVRGRCQLVAPEDWSIAGTPASVLRQAEVAARAAAGSPHGA